MFNVFCSSFDLDTQSTISYNQNITIYGMDTIHIDGTINEGESPYEYESHMLLIVSSHTMYLNGDVVSISNSILGNQLTIIGKKQIDISGIVMNLY